MYKLSRIMMILSVFAAGYCLALIAMQLPAAAYIGFGALLLAVVARRRRTQLSAHGTARWAEADDLQRAGMLGAKSGIILGRVMDGGKPSFVEALCGLFSAKVESKEACEQFLAGIQVGGKATLKPALVRLPRAVHTFFCAPTGVGKGVSCVLPFLKDCPDSAAVVDYKGENAKLTAEHRQREFGHQNVLLDPFKTVTQDPDTYNPLAQIDKDSPTAIDDCRDLAEALVTRTGQEHDMHWLDSAELFIAAETALVVRYGEPNDRSLQTVRSLLSHPAKLEMSIKLMCASDAWDGMLARMGHQLSHFKDRELGGVLTTANRLLRFLDTPAIAASTKTGSFDPADLLKGKMTVYLILPPEHARAQSPLLRMWIGSLLRAVVRGGLQEKNKVHFVLDEAASLGHMQALDDAVDKFRGYGVRLQFYYQSLGQLKKCWPDGQDQTLLGNVSQVYFGVNDYSTAEAVSNRLGEKTITVASGGTSTGTSRQSSSNGQGSFSSSSNLNDNWGQMGRKLLKPEEVMALSPRTAITFTPGVPPICTTLVRYYEEANAGKRPGAWESFKAMANIVTGSVVLLFATGYLAIAVSANSHGHAAAKQPRAAYQQRTYRH